MKDQLKATLRFEDPVCILSLAGEITTFSEQELSRIYQAAVGQKAGRILFDFKEVNYINSAGLAILIGLVNESRKKKIEITISGLSPHFKKIFKMVGLTQFAKVFDDELLALDAIRQNIVAAKPA